MDRPGGRALAAGAHGGQSGVGCGWAAVLGGREGARVGRRGREVGRDGGREGGRGRGGENVAVHREHLKYVYKTCQMDLVIEDIIYIYI